MRFKVGSLYYITFLESSKPDVPMLENIKKIYPHVYAFPVAGSIDGIIISEYKLPIHNKTSCGVTTLEMFLVDMSPNFPLKDKYDYAFLYFESNLEPKQITDIIEEVNKDLNIHKKGVRNYMIFKSGSTPSKYILFVRYRGNITLDKLWKYIYDRARRCGGVSNDHTYIVFTIRFAKMSGQNLISIPRTYT